MTVWAEQPQDNGSAVWGCSACAGSGWCPDADTALTEARVHAHAHDEPVTVTANTRGPRPDYTRDALVRDLRAHGNTIRTIAATVGLSPAGVVKALRRTA